MPFVLYTAQLKVIALTKFMAGQSLDSINVDLITSISPKSMRRWKLLYHTTHAVVRNPRTYHQQGRRTLYTNEDQQFMLELIDADPTLFLDEVQLAMYDRTDLLASRQTIANDLKECLYLTLHKVSAIDINQSPRLRADYSNRICHHPPEFLVFLGEPFSLFSISPS